MNDQDRINAQKKLKDIALRFKVLRDDVFEAYELLGTPIDMACTTKTLSSNTIPSIKNCGSTLEGSSDRIEWNDLNAPAGRIYDVYLNGVDQGLSNTDLYRDLTNLPTDGTVQTIELRYTDDNWDNYLSVSCEFIAATTVWQFDQFQEGVEGESWSIIDSHDTGYMTDHERITVPVIQDGLPAYRHSVAVDDLVEPVGADSRIISVDYSQFDKVLLRFHIWADAHSGDPGKHVALLLGFGYIGDNYPSTDKTSAQAHGSTEGAVFNLMHPAETNQTENSFGGLSICASDVDLSQAGEFGDSFGNDQVYPTGEWITIDLVAARDGYRGYANGVLFGGLACDPFTNWDDQKAIYYKNRLMHGGTVADWQARFSYNEWFGGFFVATA